MPLLTVNRGYNAGVIHPPVPYVPPQYPTRGRCWCCGRFVSGSRIWSGRKCERCGVKWVAQTTGPPAVIRVASSRELELKRLEGKWLSRTIPLDIFDRFIDHGNTHVPSPA